MVLHSPSRWPDYPQVKGLPGGLAYHSSGHLSPLTRHTPPPETQMGDGEEGHVLDSLMTTQTVSADPPMSTVAVFPVGTLMVSPLFFL